MAVLSIGQMWAGTMSVDFESAASAYTDWTITNLTTKQTDSNVDAHGGSYFGSTDGKESCSIVTKNKVNPSSIQFYVSKQSTNTNAGSVWKIEVSSDNSTWTQVGGDQPAANGITRGTWTEVTRDLSSYSDVYVRVSYSGTTAKRCIDDLVLTTAGGSTDPVAVTGVTLDQNEAEITVGGTVTLTATVAPGDATNKAVTWESDDEDVATVDDGVVTGVAEGTATITVKTVDGNKTATCEITVTAAPVASGYNVDFESAASTYTDWTFTTLVSQATNSGVTAHGGSYFGGTDGKETGSIVTKNKVANPGTLTFYVTKESNNTTASSWLIKVSSNGTDWTQVGATQSASSMSKGTWVEVTRDLSSYSNVYVGVYYEGTTAKRCIDDLSLTTVTPGTVATPTITGETPFVTTATVTLACTTDGASIYYTTDGTDPTSASTPYTEPFVVDNAGTTTVKAIAIKGSTPSAIASKEFTKVTSYSTLADIFTKATEVGSTATDIYVTFGGWKVSAKTNNNVFLTDGTNGAVIYGSGHGFNAGDVLTGTVACKVQLYKGFAELTSLNSSTTGLTVTSGSVGDPVVKTWDQLSAVNTGALVKLENLTYDGSSLSDGVNTIPTYTTFYTASFENGKSYNLTGVYQYYDTDGQILPRSAADVKEIIETFTVTYNNNPDHGTLTIKNGDDVVTSGSAVNEGTVLDIITSPAEGYKLKEVKVNGSAYAGSTLTLTENVIIAASFEENLADLVNSYVLSEIGAETSHLVAGQRVGDKVTLPLTATECSKTFVGWDADENCATEPTYAPGAEYTLALDNKLYAVYATANPGTVTNYPIDFESEVADYTDWSFDNMTSKETDSGVSAHGGSYFGTTGGKATASVTTAAKIANPASITFYVSKKSTNTTASSWKVEVSADGTDWTQVGDAQSATSMSKGNWVEVVRDLSEYSDVYVRVSYGSNTAVRCIDDLVLSAQGPATYSDYSIECQAQVATPVIAGVAADGVYTEGKEISITCATGGATIYYAIDSDEEPSTEYTGAFTVDADGAHTVKAKAVKTDMVASEIASVSFTINLPLSTMDQIFEAATAAGGTATDVNIAFGDWVVSGVSTNGKNVFVTDGTKGFIIFDSGASMGFAVGDVLSGTAACKVQLYNGAAELTTLSSTTDGLSVATGGTVTPEVKAISALTGINTGAAVTINSVQFDGEYLSDGANEIKPYSSLFAYEALENGKYYNVTGIYQQYGNTTKEILPRSAADIVEVSLSDPEISYTPASATIEKGQDLPGTVFANPHELPISYNSNNEAVATVSNTGVIALGTETGTAVITASFAGNATYAAANVTYTITVNPASVTENVVILAVYDTKYYAMSTNNASSAFIAIAVEYDGSQVTVNSAADKAAIQWTKKTSGDNTTFQDADEKYMKSADGTSMSLQEAVCNWIWDESGFYKISGTTRTFFYQNGTGFKNFATSNFNKSGYSDKAQVIVIDPANIVVSSKADPQLAYDPDELEIAAEDVASWVAPALGYVTGFDGLAAIEYGSNNESVATVTEGGEIALAGGYGTAVITATFGGNTNYLAGSATYTITVNAPAPVSTGTTYTKVTSTEDITDGEYLIVYETTSVAFNGALETLDAEGNSVAVVISGDEIAGTTAIDAAVFTIDVTAGTLQSASGKYIGVSSNSNGLKQTEEASTYTHTFSIDEGGNAVILANFEGSTMKLRYNPSTSAGNLRFRYYKNDGQQAIQLYKKDVVTPPTPAADYTRQVEINRYGTICLPNAGTISGATLFDLDYYDGANTLYLLEVNGNAMVAGRPYVFLPSATTIEVTYTDEANASAGSFRGLVGSYSQQQITADEGNYILYQNQYWLVNNEAYVGENRAYIHMEDVPDQPTPQVGQAPRRRVGMSVHSEQTTTDIEALNAAEAPVKVMINGQMYILRGEKMYDATGRMVK